MRHIALVITILALFGCGTNPGNETLVETGRFSVVYQGAFLCGEQDREVKRSIYVITDRQTGISYLSVQGCGTSELSHGKYQSEH